MSALTRGRTPGGVPNALNVEYYAQRADAGLIFAESTAISPTGVGFGKDHAQICTEEQAEGWKRVTDAVHERGGRMFLQLWHCGRNSHPDLQPDNQIPFGPSAIPASSETRIPRGGHEPVIPREMQVEEVPALIEEYRNAARLAMAAGFDAVEVHAGNGYLLDQFLRSSTNQRTDQYGGPPENRARLLWEVTEAVSQVWGEDRVGVRISPNNRAGYGMLDPEPQPLFETVVDGLEKLGIAFIDVVEGETTQGEIEPLPFDFDSLRERFSGVYISNNGHTYESGIAALRSGHADLISFGRPFVANPDLVHRLRIGAPLNQMRLESYTGEGSEGYTDYPTLEESEEGAG